MASPVTIERTYPVQGPNVVAWARVNAQGNVSSGLRLGQNDLSAAQATAYAEALLAAVAADASLRSQVAALYQAG